MRDPALERDRLVLHAPRRLAASRGVAALAVFDDLRRPLQRADLAHPGHVATIPPHAELEVLIWVEALRVDRELGHHAPPVWPAICWIRMTTNSAGFSGAKPTAMFTIPRLTSSCVVVSASHLTKYASRGVVPAKAPWRNRLFMNAPMLRRICAQSGSAFGSNTTQCVPRYRLSSRKIAVRRTAMYFHSDARRSLPCSVRDPHTTRPAAGRVRRQLTPSGFSCPISLSVNGTLNPGAPTIVTSWPAGDFQTPRFVSVRAKTPAIAPEGAKFSI